MAASKQPDKKAIPTELAAVSPEVALEADIARMKRNSERRLHASNSTAGPSKTAAKTDASAKAPKVQTSLSGWIKKPVA